MFELREVTAQYSGKTDDAKTIPALKGLDLSIQPGEQICLLGASGAGKSTLLGLLNGRIHATGGSVTYAGESLQSMPPRALRAVRRRIAWIPQDLALVPSLRVSQNVSGGQIANKGFWGMLRSLVWMSRAEQAQIYELLQQVGIPEKLFTRVDQLSGGQRQRVAIARALYQQPRVILADEPVSAVDPARAESVLNLLTTLARQSNTTLVMSLHDASLARQFFTRLIGLRDGSLVYDGAITDSELKHLYQLSP